MSVRRFPFPDPLFCRPIDPLMFQTGTRDGEDNTGCRPPFACVDLFRDTDLLLQDSLNRQGRPRKPSPGWGRWHAAGVTDEVVRLARVCRIESDDRVSSADEGGAPVGATTSSGGFAATVRGCRPPFAENSPLDCFPGAPGPQPGEGNTGCRLPFAENSPLDCFPGAPDPQPGGGYGLLPAHLVR